MGIDAFYDGFLGLLKNVVKLLGCLAIERHLRSENESFGAAIEMSLKLLDAESFISNTSGFELNGFYQLMIQRFTINSICLK